MTEILKWLPLVTVAGAGVFAYGQQDQKITTMEQAIQRQTEQQVIVVEMQKQISAGDARQQMILELLKEIREKVDK